MSHQDITRFLEDNPKALTLIGKDEMNLAEFPFASLRTKGDSRKAIVYEGWFTAPDGSRQQQRWTVQGGSLTGLPTEFDERVYVALMYITHLQDFQSRKVAFSIYQILKIMGLPDNKQEYRVVEQSLKRLMAVTFESVNALWDNETEERITTTKAFHLIETYWLRTKETSVQIREAEGVPAYLIWGREIWRSIQTNYIKNLDLDFYYSLRSPIARRLYRLLDKRLHERSQYEFDIFDLANRLAMVNYQFPSKVLEKLHPALDELVARGFLEQWQKVMVGKYTRLRFVRASTALPAPEAHQSVANSSAPANETPEPLAEAIAALVDRGITRKIAQHLASRYPAEQVFRQMAYLDWLRGHDSKKVKNPQGWLRRAIEEDFAPPEGYQTREEQEAQAAEREQREREMEAWLATQEPERREATWLDQVRGSHQVPESLVARTRDLQTLLQSQVTTPVYSTWLKNLLILTFANGAVTIAVPNQAAHDWLTHKLRKKVETALAELVGEPVKVRFAVIP